MLQNLPNHIAIIFGLTTALTFALFHYTMKKSSFSNHSNKISGGILIWIILHGVLADTLFYFETIGDTPPKMPIIGVAPLLITFIILFNTEKGKTFIDSLPLKQLTLISIVRIPVEIVLWWLFLNNSIPELMTFEGINFDVLAGLTSPIIIFIAFTNGRISKKILLIWNVVGTLLLVNIIVNALFSFPTIIQQQAFDQPNIGLLYFPFVWLPTFVAPIVLLSHLISIRQLTNK